MNQLNGVRDAQQGLEHQISVLTSSLAIVPSQLQELQLRLEQLQNEPKAYHSLCLTAIETVKQLIVGVQSTSTKFENEVSLHVHQLHSQLGQVISAQDQIVADLQCIRERVQTQWHGSNGENDGQTQESPPLEPVPSTPLVVTVAGGTSKEGRRAIEFLGQQASSNQRPIAMNDELRDDVNEVIFLWKYSGPRLAYFPEEQLASIRGKHVILVVIVPHQQNCDEVDVKLSEARERSEVVQDVVLVTLDTYGHVHECRQNQLQREKLRQILMTRAQPN